MTKPTCACVECRIRAALHGGKPETLFEVDTGEAISALGNVMGELLAHYPTPVIKVAARDLIACAKRWKREPRVAIQHTAGNA